MSTLTPVGRGLDLGPSPRADRWVATCWYLLFFNVLGFIGASLLPIPRSVAQLAATGALVLALVVAVARNPRLQIRPHALLTLTSLLVLVSAAAVLREFAPSSLFRLGRYATFVAVLWLISPAMRHGMQFLRYHLQCLGAMLALVLVGLVVAPGMARGDGRLQGILWPMPPTQVGQYAAIVVGLTAVLATNRMVDRRTATTLLLLALPTLLLSRARMAMVALAVALAVALLGQVMVNARARRLLGWLVGAAAIAAVALLPIILQFMRRGQDDTALTDLTGRKKTWEKLFAKERDLGEHWFGHGLLDKGFDGLPIDNTWLAAYQEQGLAGAAVVATIYATVLVVALVRPPSAGRSCALFLATYTLTVTYTEVGVGDTSVYLLHLYVAVAALLGTDAAESGEANGPGLNSRYPGAR